MGHALPRCASGRTALTNPTPVEAKAGAVDRAGRQRFAGAEPGYEDAGHARRSGKMCMVDVVDVARAWGKAAIGLLAWATSSAAEPMRMAARAVGEICWPADCRLRSPATSAADWRAWRARRASISANTADLRHAPRLAVGAGGARAEGGLSITGIMAWRSMICTSVRGPSPWTAMPGRCEVARALPQHGHVGGHGLAGVGVDYMVGGHDIGTPTVTILEQAAPGMPAMPSSPPAAFGNTQGSAVRDRRMRTRPSARSCSASPPAERRRWIDLGADRAHQHGGRPPRSTAGGLASSTSSGVRLVRLALAPRHLGRTQHARARRSRHPVPRHRRRRGADRRSASAPMLIQIYVSIRNREELRDTTGDPVARARTLEWSTCSPPPVYNFAFTPIIHDGDALVGHEAARLQAPAHGLQGRSMMPRNTGAGVYPGRTEHGDRLRADLAHLVAGRRRASWRCSSSRSSTPSTTTGSSASRRNRCCERERRARSAARRQGADHGTHATTAAELEAVTFYDPHEHRARRRRQHDARASGST